MTPLPCFIEATQLAWAWPGRAPFAPISFRAEPETIVWLSGPSGSGKSTLLSVVLGLHSVAHGQLRRGVGAQLVGRSDGALSAWRHQYVGVVPQGAGLIDCLSIDEHLRLLGIDKQEREAMCRRLGLGGRRFARADRLSGGEARRACLARALAPHPNVLVLDEPTAGLDAAAAETVWQAIAEAACEGAAVVVASHDAGVAQAARPPRGCVCHRVELGEPFTP